ncbi:hypothetical protein SDC9_149422 [bioreactor metagenome]|uniref:Uncharacterized protein n=1 Tax=bioreactor metagenome TaxID=1076179 RepID=A0A645EJM3_9ZZZZ
MLLAFHLLGGRARRHQRVEAGHRAAGYGDEQNGKHGLPVYRKGGKGRQINLRIGNEYAHHGGNDHNHQQIAVEIVAGLKQRPDGHHRGNQNVNKNDDMPGALRNKDGRL